MIEEVLSTLRWLFGTDQANLTWWQVALRALIIYIATLAMVRLGDGKRLLGKHAAFDVILGIIFGSVLSRAVNGDAPFWETLGAGIVLVSLHMLFARFAFHSHRFGRLIKGTSPVLIQDGQVQWDELRAHKISERDLHESLRIEAKIDDPARVQVARLERNGDISIIPKERPARIVEVQVAEGVQTIRIEMS